MIIEKEKEQEYPIEKETQKQVCQVETVLTGNLLNKFTHSPGNPQREIFHLHMPKVVGHLVPCILVASTQTSTLCSDPLHSNM